jgi:hypothetical protein
MKSFKQLSQAQRDMVRALAIPLTAKTSDGQPLVNYTSADVCKVMKLDKMSFAAVKANCSR